MSTTLNKTTLSACKRMLDELMQNDIAHPFNTPVDMDVVTDYADFIQHPMDLGTVSATLHSRGYTYLEDFERDVTTVWKNACRYNPPDNDVHKWALILQCDFVRGMQDIRRLRDRSKKRARCGEKGSGCSEMAEMRKRLSKMQKTIQQNELLLRSQKLSVVGGAKKKTAVKKLVAARTDEMPFEQKCQLSAAINRLSSTKLQKVVTILRKRGPSFGEGDGEIEIDINSLDNATLWDLEAFVRSQKRLLPRKRPRPDPLQALEALEPHLSDSPPDSASESD